MSLMPWLLCRACISVSPLSYVPALLLTSPGYAFCIGCTMIFHSGIFRENLMRGEVRKSAFWKFWYVAIGVGYPLLLFVAVVATANHYYLDTIMATVVATLAFFCNRVFLILLPLEDYLLWCLRLEKPIPSTGERFHQRGGAL